MAATIQTEEQVSLKLLVNKETNKVLFAEAGKDFVDILCSFLTLPLGTIARLVEKDSNMGPVTFGCINSLYHSVADLDEECLQTDINKEMLFRPKNPSEDYCGTIKFNIDDTEPTKYFICTKFDSSICDHYLSASANDNCWCRIPYTHSVFLKHFHKGFVKDSGTFVVTDDLIVMPNPVDFTSFGLLQNSGIKNISSVKEMIVNVTKEKVLDLLKCSFLSKSTLTDFFLGKKPSLERSRIFSCDVERSSNITIRLKLVIRKSDGKILYAQGEQDFANFILSFLTIPLGGVVRKLGGNCSLGSIDGLYKSIADFDENRYLTSKEAKNRLIDPLSKKQILPLHQSPRVKYFCYYQRESYKESIIHNEFFITDEYRKNVGGKYTELSLVNIPKSGSDERYVKRLRTYVVTDDLVFTPASSISALYLINYLETPLSDLKEKVVTIGMKECLSILKASLTSSSALTNGLCHLLTEVKKEK